MNNTALRAEAQSAGGHKESASYENHPYNGTYMVFANEEHKKFYYEKLGQARYKDCSHKALIYILGISNYKRRDEQLAEYGRYSVSDIFCCGYAVCFWEGVKLRYPKYRME